MLTHEEALRLRREAPAELDRRATAEREDFTFGVRDLRHELGVTWGGEIRLLLNQNVVVHFVPRYNDEMRFLDELPQFCVFPDDAREGEDMPHTYAAVKDLDAFDGVVFYVARARYDAIVRELVAVHERYGEWLRAPDTLFAGSEIVRLVNGRILENSLVRAESRFDGTKRTF